MPRSRISCVAVAAVPATRNQRVRHGNVLARLINVDYGTPTGGKCVSCSSTLLSASTAWDPSVNNNHCGIACAAGFYASGTACVQCSFGYYKDAVGNVSCTDCSTMNPTFLPRIDAGYYATQNIYNQSGCLGAGVFNVTNACNASSSGYYFAVPDVTLKPWPSSPNCTTISCKDSPNVKTCLTRPRAYLSCGGVDVGTCHFCGTDNV